MKKIVKFYKYQSLAEEKHFGFLQNYLNQQVYLTPLKNFNDPFEGRFSFVSFSPEYILSHPEAFNNILEQYRLNGEPNLTAEDLKVRLLSSEFQETLKNNPKVVKDLFSNHGALCLMGKNNNIPMWAYYADNHKGCCVEFECDFSYICEKANIDPEKIEKFISEINEGSGILSFGLKQYSQEFMFTRVRYENDMPVIHFEEFIKIQNQYEQIEYVVKNSLGVKYAEWRHENEFRLIANSNSEECGLLPLKDYAPFLKVTGVIAGSFIEQEKESRLRKLITEHNLKYYKALCSESSYKIIITLETTAKEYTGSDGRVAETMPMTELI